MWECRCACGTIKDVRPASLVRGASTSCGCEMRRKNSARLKGVPITHGKRNDPIYYIWRSMIQRCESPNAVGFKHYGGRGISVCERWKTFENFYADMGDRPDGMTLDRTNNELGYSPDNCAWVTPSENNNNRSTCVLISHDGMTLTATDWERKTGVPDYTILRRLRDGWPMEKVFSPLRYHRWRRP